MRSSQQDRWQFAHPQLYPQQQSTDPDQVIFLPACPSRVQLQLRRAHGSACWCTSNTTSTTHAAMLKHTAGGQLIPPDKHVATSRTTHLSTFESHSPWPESQFCSSALSMKGGDASPA